MGMSTIVVGFKPPDERWKQMKKVYDACEEAGIKIPKEVGEFFGGSPPDPSGVEVNLRVHGALTRWEEEGADGYELHVDKLPKDVKIVRFYNSW